MPPGEKKNSRYYDSEKEQKKMAEVKIVLHKRIKGVKIWLLIDGYIRKSDEKWIKESNQQFCVIYLYI